MLQAEFESALADSYPADFSEDPARRWDQVVQWAQSAAAALFLEPVEKSGEWLTAGTEALILAKQTAFLE